MPEIFRNAVIIIVLPLSILILSNCATSCKNARRERDEQEWQRHVEREREADRERARRQWDKR